MHLSVNGIKLYIDIEGSGLVPDGAVMREKPPLVLLHGGPGVDHSIYKPAFSALAGICQIIYVDHRGCGRSERGDPADWTLDQWGDDIKSLCDALGLVKPIVLGISFGGFVAQAYATRHPGHAGKLILGSTAAHVDFDMMFRAFGRIGGPAAEAIAAEHWTKPTTQTRQRYLEVCGPLYSATGSSAQEWLKRAVINHDVGNHFNGRANEMGRMDFRAALARVNCPVLVMAGAKDPLMPPEFSEVIAASLKPGLARLKIFENAAHGIYADQPEAFFASVREFVLEG